MSSLWKEWIFSNLWLFELIGAILVFCGLNAVFRYLLIYLQRKKSDQSIWRAHLEQVVSLPMRFLLWIALLAFLFDLLARSFQWGERISLMITLCKGGMIVCVCWLILRWKKSLQNALFSRPDHSLQGIDRPSIEILSKLGTVVILFISSLIILQLFGINILPLVTFGGIGAAVLGIASKDVVSNFFGGLMVYLTRPFHVHDLIELPLNHISGHIEQIGWYFTSIRDLQKKPIYIPNSLFSTGILVNLSRMTHRRIEEKISIRLQDFSKAKSVVSHLRHFLTTKETLDLQLPFSAHVAEYGSFSIDLEIKVYTKTTEYLEFMQVKQDVLLGAYEVLRKLDVEIPFPTTEVILRANQ